MLNRELKKVKSMLLQKELEKEVENNDFSKAAKLISESLK